MFYTVIQCSGWQGAPWKVEKTFTDKHEAEQFKASKHQRIDAKNDFYNVRIKSHQKPLARLTPPHDIAHVVFADGTRAIANW